MAQNTVEIQFEAQVDQFTKSIKDADKAATKFTDSVESGMKDAKKSVEKLSDGVEKGLGGSIKKIAGGVAIGNIITKGLDIAFGVLKKFSVDSVAAFGQQQDALNKLGFALKNTGEFSQDAVDGFAAFASQMQASSKYGDEVVIGQIAIAKSFGATNEQAKKLVTAAADLAATFGGSLEDKVQELGKTFSGSTGRMGMMIPALQNLTQEQLRSGAAIDLLAEKFKGAASSEVVTFTGQLTQLTNAFSDYQEEVGGVIARSGFLGDAIGVATVFLQGQTQAANDAAIAQSRLDGSLVESTSSISQLNRKLDELKLYEIDAEQILINPDWFDKLFSGLRSGTVQKNLDAVRGQIKAVQEEIVQAQLATFRAAEASYSFTKPVKPDAPKTDEQLKEISDLAALNEQKKALVLDYNAFELQMQIDKETALGENTALAYEMLVQNEQEKIDVIANAELAKASLIKSAAVKSQTESNIRAKAEIDKLKFENTTKKKISDEQVKMARQESDAKLAVTSNFLQAGMQLAKDGSREQKALQIAQATINTWTGATNALADTRPAWLAPAMAASIVAIGLANVAKIAGTKFESGGIVGGNSITGDNIPARVNSREMILNLDQQKEMFKQLNGGGGSGNSDMVNQIIAGVRSIPIIVQANSREIARLVRDERTNGFGV
jgi:hypothetical protein